MAQSKAKIAANTRYNKKVYDTITVRLKKDSAINSETVRTHAESRGESVNGFMLRAVVETIERDIAGEER